MLFKINKVIKSAHEQINIHEIIDDILVLPQGHFRTIIEILPINFDLKNEEEQDVIIDAFEAFLNSLPCPIHNDSK